MNNNCQARGTKKEGYGLRKDRGYILCMWHHFFFFPSSMDKVMAEAGKLHLSLMVSL